MIKRLSLVVLLLVSTVSSVLVFHSTANAASDYGVRVTDSLKLGGVGDPMDCSVVDMANQWNALSGEYDYKNSWNYQSNYGNARASLDQFFTDFKQKLDNGDSAGWAVTQAPEFNTTGQPENFHRMIRIYLFDKDTKFTLHDGYLQADKEIKFASYLLNPNAGCRYQYWEVGGATTNLSFTYDKIFLLASDNIIYPSDFSGTPIPGIANSSVIINPASKYVVNDKKLSLYNDIKNDGINSPYGKFGAAKDTTGQELADCWDGADQSRYKAALLYDCSEATNDLPRLVGTNRDVVIKYTIKDGSGKVLQAFNSQSLFAIPDYSFTDYGDYTVEVTFSFKDNNETLPNSIKVDDYTYKFGKMTFVVTVNGSSYYGDTSGDPDAEYPSECTTTGADTVCGPPDLTKNLYEDCSIYGTDIIGGFGCIMRNFGIWLREELLIPLFVPKASFLQNYFSEFRAFITGKLGFLIWPVEWSVNFVRAFFDGLNGTNNICGWSFGNIMGGDFKLNFCSLEQNFPAAFNTARYMIQAFTVFALISGLYGHYRRLIHT